MSIKKGMLITSLAFICLFSLIIVAAIPDIEECTTSPHHAQDLYPGKMVESCETEKHPAESFFAFVSFLSGTVFAISIYFYSSKSLATSAQRSMQENVKNEKRKKEMKLTEPVQMTRNRSRQHTGTTRSLNFSGISDFSISAESHQFQRRLMRSAPNDLIYHLPMGVKVENGVK